MKYSNKLSDAVHVLVLIALNPLDSLSSNAMAVSIHTNAGFIRQLMGALKKGGLIDSVHGHAKPTLTRETADISLLDVYKAVEGEKPLLHLDTHTNPECGVGVNIQYSLQDYYDEIQRIAEKKMSEISLEDIIRNFYKKMQTDNGENFERQINDENSRETGLL
ncbi:Rrf2 family transcriptional regulator [Frisingicoccus sp.]|uniref:Rrf2 family transcriptional regulator n=1 Tax=Frisingicoccus sp. TaxID=1918627 RepID=UPI002E77A288|nr:Rrf2 family transcriptional regulator [Frisingicoccus sp.]MEE0751355.1 Rrf2 family transcriptional regulator [Frisingicoccus sp.]